MLIANILLMSVTKIIKTKALFLLSIFVFNQRADSLFI